MDALALCCVLWAAAAQVERDAAEFARLPPYHICVEQHEAALKHRDVLRRWQNLAPSWQQERLSMAAQEAEWLVNFWYWASHASDLTCWPAERAEAYRQTRALLGCEGWIRQEWPLVPAP